ncbi:MAG: ATP-binding cassette domain-containing protein, partial [Actinomycetota bacterium]
MARPEPARRGAAPPARSRRVSADPGPAGPAAAGSGALGVVDTARTLLEVDSLRSGYGSLPVLHGISFGIHQGETVVLLGLNGAGKSTTLASIAGLLQPWSGGIHFDGHAVTGHDTHDLVARGIVLVPEGRRIFPALSVANNLRVGSWTRRKDRVAVAQNLDRVLEYFPVL